MSGLVDLRNEFNIECPRCMGMYMESAPDEIWKNSDEWTLDKKIDGERNTLQIGDDHSLLVGRNRQGFLKGVSSAGQFRHHDDQNRKIGSIKMPELEGTLLDGELTEVYTKYGKWDRDTSRRAGIGEFIGYVTWGVLFVRWKDVRAMSEGVRRKITGLVVQKIEAKYPGMVKLVDTVPATKKNLQQFFDLGFEGAVAKKWSAGIPIGQRSNPFWWKLKTDKPIDAFIVGVTESKEGGSGITGVRPKPNGRAATFSMGMYKNGVVLVIAEMTNLPSDATLYGLSHFEQYRGRVAEMTVSGWDGSKFRWPRFKRWRYDKGPDDCQFSEQIGGAK